MPKLGNALDFSQLEALNIRIHQAGSAPTSPTPVKGQMYFNNVGNELYYYDGTIWQSAKSGAGSSGPPSGPAGGNLAGTYPNPTIGLLQVDDTHVKAANKDGASATPSLRTLGTGAAQAAAGNDARLSDTRTPTAHKASHEPGGGDAMAVDAAVGTGSLRRIGTGAQQAMAGDTRLDTIAAPTGNVNLNNRNLINVADPSSIYDGANKQYVDSVAQGLDAKASVRVATTANITLSGTQTIDSIGVVAGDRVLVKDQTTIANNGIYVVAAGAWTRATDADTWNELVAAFTFVEDGITQVDSGWVCIANQGGTLGSSGVLWTQFSGAGSITSGAGLTKTGNVLDVGAGAGITVNADTVQVANNGITNAMIADGAIDLNTADVTGALPIAKGGTGATTAAAARTALGDAGYYSSATHGAGTTISISQATHGLRASRGLLVQVQTEADGGVVLPDVTVAANGDVTVTFAVSQSANTVRVTVIG